MASKHPRVITIDGPAGAGKSTAAKTLAKRLGCAHLDTGAMYRAVTLKALRENIDVTDEDAVTQLARQTKIDLCCEGDATKVFLDGDDVSEAIRTVEVTNATSPVARIKGVREVMVELQRHIAQDKDVVVEGRDAGSVVFPNADYKFYLDAGPAERARRRAKELAEKGTPVDEQDLVKDIERRDHLDQTRAVSPLTKTEDAIVIDSSGLSLDEVVEKMIEIVNR